MENVSFLPFFITFPPYRPIYSRGLAKHHNGRVDRGGRLIPNGDKGCCKGEIPLFTKAVGS